MDAIKLLKDVDEGNITPLDAYLQIDKQIKELEAAKDQIKMLAYEFVNKTGEKVYQYNGLKISCQSKTTWNYKHIPEWNSAKVKLSEIEEKAKMAVRAEIANAETGEIIIPAIPSYSYFLKIEGNGR